MKLGYRVWDKALQFLATGEAIELSDLPFNSNQQLYAKRTLREMEELDWLTKVSDDPPVWDAGPVAQRCMALPHSEKIDEADCWNTRDNTASNNNRPAHYPISRDNLDSTPLDVCNNCGCELSFEDTAYEAHWFRYEGSNNAAGSGWVTYCKECSPPGIV